MYICIHVYIIYIYIYIHMFIYNTYQAMSEAFLYDCIRVDVGRNRLVAVGHDQAGQLSLLIPFVVCSCPLLNLACV